MDTNNFQRLGSISNAHVGRDFETIARTYFELQGIHLTADFPVAVGASADKKCRKFDLGAENPPVLVECKSHRWTSGGNIPSAKITVWNEAMYYFYLAPQHFRKVLFVLRDHSKRRGESLAEYYVRNYGHLIPDGVEIQEFNEGTKAVHSVLTTASTRTGFSARAPKPAG